MDPLSTLSLVFLAPVAVVLGLVGYTALRANIPALGYWLFGWAAILTSLCFAVGVPESSGIRSVGILFGSLAAPLMALGAYVHVAVAPPTWVIPFGFLLGVSRLTLSQLGFSHFAQSSGGIFILLFSFLAAETIRRYSKQRDENISTPDIFLIGGFVLLGIVGFLDASLLLAEWPASYVWSVRLMAGVPLFSLQASLYIHRLGRNATSNSAEAEANAQRLRLLIESSQDIVTEFDDQGTILYVSSNVNQIANQNPADLVQRNVFDFSTFSDDSPIKRSIDQYGRITAEAVAATDQPQLNSASMPDGTERWFESTNTTYLAASGDLRVIACFRDVTARVEKQAETKKNETRLLNAERIANLGSWEYYAAENKVIWSDQMFRMHGFPQSRNQIEVSEISSLIHPNDLDRVLNVVHISGNDGRVIDETHRIFRADNGESRELRTLLETELDNHGKIVRVTGASMDVTDQLEAERLLRRGEEHLRRFVESNIAGVFYVDRTRLIPEANDAFLSLLGYSIEDLPLALETILPPEEIPYDDNAREEILRTGVVLPHERNYVARSGERIPMLVGCTRIDSEVAMIVAIDLSERKRAEAYINRYQYELEETIADRTRELMQSRDRLIEKDRLASVGTLAAGIAHQINNPIGAILNSAEFALLCRDDVDSKAAFEKALRVNRDEARRCARIVKSMLQFSRDQPTAKWSEDLNQIILRSHRAISPYATDRSASVEIQLPKSPVIAVISPIEIEQAVVNVLRNAIESRSMGASISLSLTKRDKAAEIEILDDGRGIPKQDRDHLFEPFFSTRTNSGGTGLGLSVAHGILTEHGGEIRIDSIPGEGTRVLMILPLVEGEPD